MNSQDAGHIPEVGAVETGTLMPDGVQGTDRAPAGRDLPTESEFRRRATTIRATRHELGVLARDYIDAIEEIELIRVINHESGSSYDSPYQCYARQRLATIKSVLGEEDYRLETEEKVWEWDERWAEAREGNASNADSK